MKIVVNGEPREIADAVNVGELVAKLALPAPATLVEHNGLALRRSEWVTRTIADGDRVELIRIVAGG